jgi:hypothetical protein
VRLVTVRFRGIKQQEEKWMRTYTIDIEQRGAASIPLLTFHQLIKKLKGPITRSQRTGIIGLIDTEAPIIAYDVAKQYSREFEEAAAKACEIDRKLENTETLRTAAQADLPTAEADRGSVIRAAIYWCCAFAVAACEYFITNVTLPMALDVDRESLLGVALSLGPTVAFVFVELPLEALQQSSWRKTYKAFLWLVLLGHLGAVALLGLAREEVMHVVRQLNHGQADITFEGVALNRAIVTIGVLLVIDGALFLLHATQHGQRWRRYRRALSRARKLEKRWQALLAEQTAHAPVVALTRQLMSEQRPDLIAQHFKQQCLVDLDTVEVVEPTSVQKIERALGLALDASPAKAVMN